MTPAADTARPPDEDQTVRLEVPARPGYILLARLALSAVCRLTQLGDEDVADLKLAITEAATAFVGDGDADADESGEPLRPVPHPDEAMLRFAFALTDDRLVVDVTCDCDVDISADDGELARAIINATVDECESRPGAIRLVKHLGGPEG